ncbi:MAG: A/G-specific adenine glycosylase [Bacilli bacterium]|nr:A/G-specific adenine glycosylase [Bacilli bacterium]MBN2877794.1 A/G-specific adenine glycosylase [Bacilli bacterium]
MDKIQFQTALLDWYDQNKRILPWRDNPNPYHVWVSEIMLQQTRVEAVIPYFERFIKAVPTISDLATIEDDLLAKLWEGLGYYSRAKNLKKAAIQIVEKHNGKLPDNKQDLLSLSGIGPYTAGAISSIAFDKREAAMDGNVLRVFARLLANTRDLSNTQVRAAIQTQVEDVLPNTRNGDFTQALMEIGATVCIPNGSPHCEKCPFQEICKAALEGLTEQIPLKRKKIYRRLQNRTILILELDGQIYIEKRPDKGLLAGLYQFINLSGHLNEAELESRFPSAISIQKIDSAKHIFSHLEWHMFGYHIQLSKKMDDYILVDPEELVNTYSIPSAFQTYKDYILNKKGL